MTASKIKRVPLRGTPSLKDILEEDLAAETEAETPKSEIADQKEEIRNKKDEIVNPISDIRYPINEIENKIQEIVNPISDIGKRKAEKGDKSEYQKITTTLDPKMLWLLDDERRRRRMAKLDYSYSEIIREALTDYFVKQGREI